MDKAAIAQATEEFDSAQTAVDNGFTNYNGKPETQTAIALLSLAQVAITIGRLVVQITAEEMES